MPAVKTDLVIEQGTSFAHGWLTSLNGAPIGPDWTARCQIRARVTSDRVLFAPVVEVREDGIVVLSVAPEQSSLWTWRSGVYDVEAVSPTGIVLRVAGGKVTVEPEVTR